MILQAALVHTYHAPTSVWQANREVYAVEADESGLLSLTTDSGVIRQVGGGWELTLASRSADPQAQPINLPLPAGSPGTHITATIPWSEGSLVSVWGDPNLWLLKESGYKKALTAPGKGEVYSLFAYPGWLAAGTSQGGFVYKNDAWVRVDLPSALPTVRAQAVAPLSDGNWVIGSLDGLWSGKPGAWKQIDDSPVRQVLRMENDVWVLKGSGAVDKLNFKEDRHYHDVLYGSAKRTFASCLASVGGELYIGGYGGWIKRGQKQEEVYPPVLKDQVVTAILPSGQDVWVGTQLGLYRYSSKTKKAVSVKGLERVWITALALHDKQVYVGGHTGPLYVLQDGKPVKVEGPPEDIRTLTSAGDSLIVGCPQKVFERKDTLWNGLNTARKETLSTGVVDKAVWVGTAAGLFQFDLRYLRAFRLKPIQEGVRLKK